MSFLDRFKGAGRTKTEAAPAASFDDLDLPDNPMEATVRLGGGAFPATSAPRDAGAAAGTAADSSIISEAAPSEMAPEFAETRLPGTTAEAPSFTSGLPVIGAWPLARQQRALTWTFGLGLLLLLVAVVGALLAGNRNATQVAAVGQATTQSQRLAKSVSQALVGSAAAFPEVRESAGILVANVTSLQTGEGSVPAAPAALQETIAALLPQVQRAERNAAIVLTQQQTLTQVGAALRAINRQSADLLELAETVSSLKLQRGASAAELSAVGQLVMLTQRIGKSANEFLTTEGVSAEAVFLLGKDLNSFREIAEGVLAGNAELRLPGTRDPETRERLEQLIKQYEQTRTEASAILSNLQGLVAAREAQAAIVADQTSRSQVAEAQRLEAERQEQEAKRVNDANQAAILRLMNELQTVAEGDLTQQATVTEDITGAIADSVNYTVEELRMLVAQVQSTVSRVTDTTSQVEQTSTELLAASTEQLREIRETGESVLQMAGRINDVSSQAQQTAQVAQQSLRAAEAGLSAVQDTIGGMNTIRDQIQETSKRIKRLGESSQEIGEITELISDITEQTNVLALNAAIQAASAGEAGRGFSVVAEEVQRLAERSGDATRQIAAIVRTIQTDTQDAVAAMERSTQGVVEGAKLSDAAGAALADIDRVTRELSELIARISAEASREAESANVVAENIQHIFAVTEQTSDGTRSTAQMVRELSRTAEELKASVARFKIG